MVRPLARNDSCRHSGPPRTTEVAAPPSNEASGTSSAGLASCWFTLLILPGIGRYRTAAWGAIPLGSSLPYTTSADHMLRAEAQAQVRPRLAAARIALAAGRPGQAAER